jgi:hypothetical protein
MIFDHYCVVGDGMKIGRSFFQTADLVSDTIFPLVLLSHKTKWHCQDTGYQVSENNIGNWFK